MAHFKGLGRSANGYFDAGMVTMEQVFLPYMTSNGETLYDHLRGNQFKLKSGE